MLDGRRLHAVDEDFDLYLSIHRIRAAPQPPAAAAFFLLPYSCMKGTRLEDVSRKSAANFLRSMSSANSEDSSEASMFDRVDVAMYRNSCVLRLDRVVRCKGR